jgi:uncharacterized membrane protein YhaH (DUF805 family)
MSNPVCNEPAAPEKDRTPFVSVYSGLNAAENISLWRGFADGWKKYAVFDGRARRKEFWGWIFFNAAIFLPILFASYFLDAVTESDIFLNFTLCAYMFASAVPHTAIAVRRLHDTGLSGWNVLFFLIPFTVYTIDILINTISDEEFSALDTVEDIGDLFMIVFIVFCCLNSKLGVNKFGPNPKGLN